MSKIYFEDPSINQSYLKNVMKNPLGFVSFKKKGKALSIGSAVDCILTTPELYNETFIEIPNIKTSKDVMKILDYVYEKDLDITDVDLIIHLANQPYYGKEESAPYCGHMTNKQKRYERIVNEESLAYVEYLKNKNGRTLIDPKNLQVINHCVNLFENHIFVQDMINYQKCYNQLFLKFKYRDYDCKALLDKVLINDTNETIKFYCGIELPPHSLLPIDIKTGAGRPESLNEYMMKWRIDFQLAWYYSALKWSKGYSDYHICNPVIIYTQTNIYTQYPSVKQLSLNELYMGRYGAWEHNSIIMPNYEYKYPHRQGFKYYGFEQALSILEMYDENNDKETHWELNNNNGLCNDFI